jgi:DhnA family fructose-bisphosphate aldolase class Ia
MANWRLGLHLGTAIVRINMKGNAVAYKDAISYVYPVCG